MLWVLPLVYAFWTAFHPGEFSTRFALAAPLTLDNFVRAWQAAPFARYFLNTTLLVTMVLAAQLVLVTLAAYALARFEFPGRGILFALVLVQLMRRFISGPIERSNSRTASCTRSGIGKLACPLSARTL